MNRRLAILPLVAMAALGLAACSSTTTGQGTPVTTPAQGGSTGGSSPSSSASSGGGSSALAAVQLLREAGAEIVAAAFVIDLPALGGAAKLRAAGVPVSTLVAFEGH